MIVVQQVQSADVLMGRGGASNNHSGNRQFRALVARHQPEYLRAPKKEKSRIARRIVSMIRQECGGRFLRRDEATGCWIDVGDKKAAEKTSQALREGLDVRNKRTRKTTRTAGGGGGMLEGTEHNVRRNKKRRVIVSGDDEKQLHAAHSSPALVSEAGELGQMPDLEEEIEHVMPKFIFHKPPVTTEDCDDVVPV